MRMSCFHRRLFGPVSALGLLLLGRSEAGSAPHDGIILMGRRSKGHPEPNGGGCKGLAPEHKSSIFEA